MRYEIAVKEVREESTDAYTLILDKPEEFTFLPGQFVHIQYPIQEKLLRRSYSIASSPTESEIHITIRVQPEGKMSPVLKSVPPGTVLTIHGPFGDFQLGEEEHSICIAAGSGITPFVSMIRSYTGKRQITLLYTNKYKENMLYHNELEQNKEITYIPTLTQENWNGKTGRFTPEDIPTDSKATYYICGPNQFIRAIQELLKEKNIARIKTENYGNIQKS